MRETENLKMSARLGPVPLGDVYCFKYIKINLSTRPGNNLRIVCPNCNALSNHLDRIYVCSDIKGCYNLINRMKLYYGNIKLNNKKDNINDKWIIYQIDTTGLNIKLFNDPNYVDGYYIIDNIPSNLIKVIDKE